MSIANQTLVAGLRVLLRLRSDPWSTRRGLIEPLASYRAPQTEDGALTVALVQMRLDFLPDGAAFARMASERVREATLRGARLIVFPEDMGSGLLGMIPGLRDKASRLSSGAPPNDSGGEIGGVSVADVFELVAPHASRVYHATFSRLARAYGVTIMGGSIIERAPANSTAAGAPPLQTAAARRPLRNVAYLFDPNGTMVARQDKVHLFPAEDHWGIGPGSHLLVAPAEGSWLSTPICMDMGYWESARIATEAGAEVLICPSANPESYNWWKERRGTWGRVQECPAYGLFASMVGDFAGLPIRGRSAIFAPTAMTPARDGVVAEAATADQEEIVTARLDLRALRDERRARSRALNRVLLRRYLPAIYGGE